MEKDRLVSWFREKGAAAIAFSGGVDSAFLLACAVEALGENAVAFTVQSAFFPNWEKNDAQAVAKHVGAEHVLLQADVLADDDIIKNDNKRCYYCKRRVFSLIKDKAHKRGIETLCDGSNADDVSDYRPGEEAAKELGVFSPLKELGYTKKEIRALSAEMGLKTASKPAYACLATRIPTGERLTDERLRRVESGEDYLHALGYAAVRLRDHGEIARIELSPDDMAKFYYEDWQKVAAEIEKLGYRYVTLDIGGYKMGSMNAREER